MSKYQQLEKLLALPCLQFHPVLRVGFISATNGMVFDSGELLDSEHPAETLLGLYKNLRDQMDVRHREVIDYIEAVQRGEEPEPVAENVCVAIPKDPIPGEGGH